jgi:hypothetical protein
MDNEAIMFVDYHNFNETCMTVCCITMKNGFTVTGQSCTVNPENFNEALGKEFAYKDALAKVTELEAYRVKEADYQAALAKAKLRDDDNNYSLYYAKRFYKVKAASMKDHQDDGDNGMWDTSYTYI